MDPPASESTTPSPGSTVSPDPAPPGEADSQPWTVHLNPWISLWTRPRATMRQILDADPRRFVRRLVVIGWVAGMTESLVLSDWAEKMPGAFLPVTFLLTATLGSVLAIALLYLNGLLLRVTGGWLEGRGDAASVRAALAWAQAVPSVWRLLLIPPWIAALGAEAFHFQPSLERFLDPGVLLMLLIQAGVGLWQLVVFLKCLGEAHRFSAWRALGATILEVLILLVPFAILVLLWVWAGGPVPGV